MRIVFLDVDGVLNCISTADRYQGFIGIDSELVGNLAEFMRRSSKEEETVIVLSSSWRIGQDREGAKIPGGYQYLMDKLAEYGLSIYDDTPRLVWGVRGRSRRGREIAGWLYNNRDKEISGYVVLDDELFADLDKYHISPHLVRTSFDDEDGGFRKKHINEALKLIRVKVTSD